MLPADGDDSMALLKAVQTLRNASNSFRDRSLPLLIIATFDIVPRILFSPLLFLFLSPEMKQGDEKDGETDRWRDRAPLSLSLSLSRINTASY